ncbi:MAG: TldD/PmbA family protein [Oscillospiraceae bacterium]|jgi:TldD protein|nr:TldD/PmbA family protein [Oscillospiraceae bacterium]
MPILPENTELRIQETRTRRVTLLGGNLVANTRTRQSGVSARTLRGGLYGFASDADTDDAAVQRVLKAAADNAAFLDTRVARTSPPLPVPAGLSYTRTADETDAAQSEYLDFARAIDAYIAQKYPDLAGRIVSVAADRYHKRVYTDFGTVSESLQPRCYAYVFLTANTADGSTVELYEVYGAGGTLRENFAAPADLFPEVDKLYEQLRRKAEGIYPDAGGHTVVLAPKLAGMLAHEAVGHTCEADLVLAGSVAGDNLGKSVASELVSLVDFAHTCHDGSPAPLPVFVDDEGVAASDAVLIENGILRGYMHSRESAQHYGAQPTGNARAFAYSDEPLIRMRNTAILPGTAKCADMIAGVERGYYLTETNNGQADTTGEFMFGVCMGYEIVHGKLGRALRDTTISGVAFEMLKTVDALSDDFEWVSSGFCGKKQLMPVGCGGPAVRCRVNIGGR